MTHASLRSILGILFAGALFLNPLAALAAVDPIPVCSTSFDDVYTTTLGGHYSWDIFLPDGTQFNSSGSDHVWTLGTGSGDVDFGQSSPTGVWHYVETIDATMESTCMGGYAACSAATPPIDLELEIEASCSGGGGGGGGATTTPICTGIATTTPAGMVQMAFCDVFGAGNLLDQAIPALEQGGGILLAFLAALVIITSLGGGGRRVLKA